MTLYAITLLATIPVRNTPTELAEQTTQLVFGDLVKIEQETEKWVAIHNCFDDQRGWVDKKMLTLLNKKAFSQLVNDVSFALTSVPLTYIEWSDGSRLPLSIGSRLYNYRDGQFRIGRKKASIGKIDVITVPYTLSLDNLKRVCFPLLGTPYLWGGKNILGFDCSGFTQVVMHLFGIRFKRNAGEQAEQGINIAHFEDIQPGDLLFFGSSQTTISHVGIALDTHNIIHCSGQVKIDNITDAGIWTHKNNKPFLSHILRRVQRVSPNME